MTRSEELLILLQLRPSSTFKEETTSAFVGSTIAAGDPIPTVTSVSVASSIPAATPIAAGVSTTADDPEAEFKRYLRQASDDDEPAKPVSFALVSDITT
uniref:Uncharacterized protein n=1 Tax=Tanacetum cinerariifolium TaxID=118510 RepID=A0A699RPF7_TANCI|nr:hypothetical protein [Tanacetum cinerariifolium]